MSLPLKQTIQILGEADTSNNPVSEYLIYGVATAQAPRALPRSPDLPRLWKDRNPGCLSWALTLLSVALRVNPLSAAKSQRKTPVSLPIPPPHFLVDFSGTGLASKRINFIFIILRSIKTYNTLTKDNVSREYL